MKTNELIKELMDSKRYVGSITIKVEKEIIQRLREYDELKEIIFSGISGVYDFLKDLQIHEK